MDTHTHIDNVFGTVGEEAGANVSRVCTTLSGHKGQRMDLDTYLKGVNPESNEL